MNILTTLIFLTLGAADPSPSCKTEDLPMKSVPPRSLTLPVLTCAFLLPLVVGAMACGDEAALPTGTGGTPGAAGTSVIPTGGSAGSAVVTTGGSGVTPTAGTGPVTTAGTSAGGVSSGGTGPTAGTAPVSGTGPTAGASGTGTVGGTAAGGTSGDLVTAVGGPLDGSMLLGKCLTDSATSVCQTINGGCPAANQQDPALSGVITTDKMITLGGDPNVTYTITLHVQGEAESKRYTGGADANSSAQSPKADGFCTGGTPTNGDAYNVYMVRVTSPKQDYFLNSMQPPGVSNHTTYGLDYTAKIQAKGGTTIRLVAADSNCSMIKNCGPMENSGNACTAPIILANVDPKATAKNPTFDFTKAFNGQWLVMVVTDVTAN
jgi:hypothetical protein